MKLYLATGNLHKLGELRAMLEQAGLPIEVAAPSAIGGMPTVDEDAPTFAGNASKKARALAACLPPESWSLADDSGLCVDALDGEPGVRSARYAGDGASDAENVEKLLRALSSVPGARRGAAFHCVLALVAPNGEERLFEGQCRGSILDAPRGGGGFGYDPVFCPEGLDLSFAELSEAEKASLSHRGAAMDQFLEYLRAATSSV